MARMTLHEGDRVVFLKRDGDITTGVLLVVPWGRRTWAGIRTHGQLHVVPRSNIIAVNPPLLQPPQKPTNGLERVDGSEHVEYVKKQDRQEGEPRGGPQYVRHEPLLLPHEPHVSDAEDRERGDDDDVGGGEIQLVD